MDARGPSTQHAPSTTLGQATVAAHSLSLYVAIYLLFHWLTDAVPTLTWTASVLWAAAFGLLHVFFKRKLHWSYGSWAWRSGHTNHPAFPFLLALITLGTSAWSGLAWTWRHPMLLVAKTIQVPEPETNLERSDPTVQWTTAPYFFVLSAWPRVFANEPVIHSFPYEKGPPIQFAGKIISRWKIPDIQVVFEGPKTPSIATQIDRPQLQQCLQTAPIGGQCATLRRAVLERHWQDIQRAVQPKRASWSLRWMTPNKPEGAQGFVLEGCGKFRCKTRWVLINGRGYQQSISLERRQDDAGTKALQTMWKSLATSRLSNELYSGKALANFRLSEVRLDRITPNDNLLTMGEKISEIQSLLLSKISVEPSNIDAYYHLAGTALMLLKKAESIRQGPRLASGRALELSDGWSAAAKTLIHSAFQYTKDIDQNHNLSKRLENLWLDVSKRY